MSARPRHKTRLEVIQLEDRRLLAFAATWVGQQNLLDYVGTDQISPQSANDYVDEQIHLSSLSGPVAAIQVRRLNEGEWDYNANGAPGTAAFIPLANDNTAGDVYFDSKYADPVGTFYDNIIVIYVGGASEKVTLHSTSAINPNLRDPGKSLQIGGAAQDGSDWTSQGISVGSDGFQDVHVPIANLSQNADFSKVQITASPNGNPPGGWEYGQNLDGAWSAEFLHRTGGFGGTSGDLYFSPNADLAGQSLQVVVTYAAHNPDGSPTNRGGKTDTATYVVPATTHTPPTNPMPAVAAQAELAATAHDTPQSPAAQSGGGMAHVVIDTLPVNQAGTQLTTANVAAAVLSDSYGTTWTYGSAYTNDTHALTMTFDAPSGTFSYPPARDEYGSRLTLRLIFNDLYQTQAVARLVATTSSNVTLQAPPLGPTTDTVSTAAALDADVNTNHIATIHLTPGTYTLNLTRPLNVTYPANIYADFGSHVTLLFTPSAGDPNWQNSAGAINVTVGNVTLNNFTVAFSTSTAAWTNASKAVIQSAGPGRKYGLLYENLNLQAPVAAGSSLEAAVPLINLDPLDSGQITGNVLKGGGIQSLASGPWLVADNDFQGAQPNTVIGDEIQVPAFHHDVVIRGNHLHPVGPSGETSRFLEMGSADSAQGLGDVVMDNTVDGGFGRSATDGGNTPEDIITESYEPHYEGSAAAVSADGYVLAIPPGPNSGLRGVPVQTGDVVAILSGPYAGTWRLIAQAISATQYLLDSPLPSGLGNAAISLNRGFVNETFKGNLIDLRGTGVNPGNAGIP